MYKDTDYLFDAIFQLQQEVGISIDLEKNRTDFDAIATIENTQFIVIAKSEVRSTNKGLVLSDVKNIKSKTNKPVIIIAKFIAREIAKELKENEVNYIDRAGNAYIKHRRLIILVTGLKTKKPTNTNQSRAFQESGIKLILQILSQPQDLQLSYRNLADKTGIALGSVSIIMKELEELRFIIKAKNKRHLKNEHELLKRWILAYNDVLRPRLLKKRFHFSNNETYREWQKLPLAELDGKNLWGGETGASILTKHLQPQNYTIYTDGEWQNIARKFKLIPDDDGDIELLSVFWKSNEQHDLKNIVPTLIVIAELMGSGKERNIETAKLIIENELQHIK